MIYVFVIVAFLYSILILSFAIGFSIIKKTDIPKTTAETRFSILVPFRDEEHNLPAFIKSLDELDYPKQLFELILINDDSQDDSVELSLRLLTCTQIGFRIIENKRASNSPKKDAITAAMTMVKHPWVITTDADCEVPKLWLQSLNDFIINNNPQMIVAPVAYNTKNTILDQFQLLDIISLQGATIGGFGLKKPFLCNGANFAYKKEFFQTLNGFEGNDNIASGDDIFLLEKATKHSSKSIKYLKSTEAIVKTKPQDSFSSLIQQRVRWAAKSSAYNNLFGKLVGLIVLLMNGAIIGAFLLSFFGVFNLLYTLIFFALKLSIDYLLLYKSAKFFNQTQALRFYIFSAVFYPMFSTFIAVYSIFKGYKWKGRHFNK